MANTKVTTGVIKDDAVGADQLAPNAVVTASMVDNAVTTAKIANDAILTAKISDNAVNNAKLSSNSVDSDQYVDGSIDTAHIADSQITSAKLDTNIAVGGTLTVGSHLIMGDDDILKMGTDADLKIYHTATNNHSIIEETGGGNLVVRTNGSHIEFDKGSTEFMTRMIVDGAVELYYAGAKKLETVSGGVTVTGTATATNMQVSNGGKYIFGGENTRMTGEIDGNGKIRLFTGGTEKVILDGANVGIGTSSITNNTLGQTTYFGNSTSFITGDSSSARFWLGNNWYYNSGDKFIGTGYANLYTQQSGSHEFLTSTASGTAGAAATFTSVLKIDSSGNLLVGKTATDIGTVGHQFLSDGQGDYAAHTSSGTRALLLNRKTSDGEIVEFRKDGTVVGSIGTEGNDLSIGNGDAGLQFINGTQSVRPFNMTTNARLDNAIDLGMSTTRFKDLYLSGNSYANTYRHDGDSDTYLNFPAANQLSLVGGGATLFKAYQIAGAYGVLEAHGSGSATYPNYTFNGDSNTGMYRAAADTLAFTTAGSERLRIDSSGNLLLGKTAASIGTVGCELRNDGYILGINDGDAPLYLNRLSSDGDIAKFYKDGTAVGSIKADAGSIGIGSGDCGLLFYDAGNRIIPRNGTGTSDASLDLGYGTDRFKDLYLSGNANTGKLTVGTTSSGQTLIQMLANPTNGANTIHFGDGAGAAAYTGYINYAHADNSLQFGNSGVEKMRINSNGTLIVGTTANPSWPHRIYASGNAITNGTAFFEDTDGSCGLANVVLKLSFSNDADATNASFLYMTDANGAIGSIGVASGTSVSFNTTSDERLKKNIVDASSQLDTIKNIKVREFDWKKNDFHEVGVIAQEIKTLVPNAVQEGGDDVTKHPFGVDYGKIVPYLIKAIQEQQTLIESLTARIETLEG